MQKTEFGRYASEGSNGEMKQERNGAEDEEPYALVVENISHY